jgi:hypothetical protein
MAYKSFLTRRLPSPAVRRSVEINMDYPQLDAPYALGYLIDRAISGNMPCSCIFQAAPTKHLGVAIRSAMLFTFSALLRYPQG